MRKSLVGEGVVGIPLEGLEVSTLEEPSSALVDVGVVSEAVGGVETACVEEVSELEGIKTGPDE